MLDIVLINIGRKAVGVIGIALLYLIPVWYFCVSYAENTGMMYHIPRDSIERGEEQEQTVPKRDA